MFISYEVFCEVCRRQVECQHLMRHLIFNNWTNQIDYFLRGDRNQMSPPGNRKTKKYKPSEVRIGKEFYSISCNRSTISATRYSPLRPQLFQHLR